MFLISTVNRAFTRFSALADDLPASASFGYPVGHRLLSSLVEPDQEQTLPIRCPLCGARLSVVLALTKPASTWQSYTCPACMRPSQVMFEGTIKWVGHRVDPPSTSTGDDN